ncbi:MAG TPA: NAD-dependent malic enzyme, partial [Anaerolineae bacterium]|nr:NAD-dependent malic enzyme [Anaerolineae bacterium]
KMSEVRIVFVGSGASNVACSRLIFTSGANPALCMMVDSKGILNKNRHDIELRKAEFIDKWKLCQITNAEQREGNIGDALKGADVVVALSTPGPDVIKAEWIKGMAKDAIVFACANPVPEIWPWDAKNAGAAVVATGRSDFPNQVNNSLGFPGIFRGTLDVRAKTITDEMCLAAAKALADMAAEKGITADYILPNMDEFDVFAREAAAVATKAVEQGIARKTVTYEEEYQHASSIIKNARDMTQLLMEEGFIAESE